MSTTSAPAAPAPGGRVRPSTRPDHLRVFMQQLPFLAVAILLVIGYVSFDPQVFQSELVFAGVMVLVLATAVSITLPWHRLDVRWAIAVPLMDIVSVGLMQAGGMNAGYTLVLPVLWMSTSYGLVGLVSSVLGGTVAAWSTNLPGPALAEIEVLDVQRLFLLPLILAAAGTYLYLAERRSTARRDLLGRQSALLEEILADANHQRQMLETILDTIDVGVIALDADARITMANRSHTVLAGTRLQVGDTIEDYLAEDPQVRGPDGVSPLPLGELPVTRLMAGEDPEPVLTRWTGADGVQRAFRVSAGRLRHEEGGAVIAYHDLSAEMAAMAQLEDFISSVSHELRTPLTSIMGYIDLVVDDEEVPAGAKAQLAVAGRNAERLQRLIGDLLTAAQTRRGELSVSRSPTALCALVTEAVQSQRPRALEAGVTVTNRAKTACQVRADRARMAQVIDNVLSNAIKYSRPGGTVSIDLHRSDGEVSLEVADDGIGIAEEDQQHLFDRFYRAGSVRRGPVQGTGLGLHITRQIVEAHGGRINLASELGVGTRVTVTLPAMLPEDG